MADNSGNMGTRARTRWGTSKPDYLLRTDRKGKPPPRGILDQFDFEGNTLAEHRGKDSQGAGKGTRTAIPLTECNSSHQSTRNSPRTLRSIHNSNRRRRRSRSNHNNRHSSNSSSI
jgi:hypothetical protein